MLDQSVGPCLRVHRSSRGLEAVARCADTRYLNLNDGAEVTQRVHADSLLLCCCTGMPGAAHDCTLEPCRDTRCMWSGHLMYRTNIYVENKRPTVFVSRESISLALRVGPRISGHLRSDEGPALVA
jgi:hypothetical protein